MARGMILKDDSITIVIGIRPYTILRENPNYDKFKNHDQFTDEQLLAWVDYKKVIEDVSHGKCKVVNGKVFYKDNEIHSAIATKIRQLIDGGFDVLPALKFMDRLMKNPFKSVVDELYAFMEREGVVISDDGYILAYKRLRQDMTDVYSGTNKHTLGCTIEVEMNEVDDDRRLACSTGLHIGSFAYVGHFAAHGENPICLVRVNPKHVVCVPQYEADKMRVCKYKVLDFFTEDVGMKGHYDNEGNKIEPRLSQDFVPRAEPANVSYTNVHDNTKYVVDDDEVVDDWEDEDDKPWDDKWYGQF